MRNLILTLLPALIGVSLSSQPTVSDLTAPQEVNEGVFETYTSVMDDPLGQGLTCTWDFGDGTVKVLMDRSSTGHLYKDDGTYSIELTVQDGNGEEASASVNLTVRNVDPEIRLLKGTLDKSTDKMVMFESVVHDPGDDELLYIWEFGDGQEQEGRHLETTSHIYDEKGTYTVRLTVEDGDGGVHSKVTQVMVDEVWESSFNGYVNINLSGGSALLYNNYVYEGTNNLSACYKQLALFDDDQKCIVVFALKDRNPLTDFTHGLAKGGPHGIMSAMLFYNIPEGVYDNFKGRYQPMEVLDDVLNDMTISNMMQYTKMGNYRPSDYSGYLPFHAVSGTFSTEPLHGNILKGTFSMTMEAENEDRDMPPHVVTGSGSFEVNVNQTIREQMARGCEDQAGEFSLIDRTPEDNQENVHPEFPCMELEFSSDLDMQSIDEENIQIGYYDENYLFKTTPVDFEVISENHIKVIPVSPLRPGVKYTCFVMGGNDGVKDIDGGKLDDDYEWKFSTLVEPNDARVRVYQSVADAPLITDKEAMVRIEVFWDKPDDLADESFVREFPASVAIRNEGGSRVCPDRRRAVFKHYDEISAEDIRFARNSVNVYGWKPDDGDGDKIEIEIKPLYQECVPEDEQIKYKINHAIEHWDKSPRLHVQYYFLKIHTWEDGVPAEEIAMGEEIMQKAMEFGQQMFPVRKMTSQNMGEAYVDPALYFDGDAVEGITDMATSLWNADKFDEAVRDFYFETGIHSQADVVVVFHPFILGQGGTGGAFQSFGDDSERPIPVARRFLHMTVTSRALSRAAIEHEIGHTCYLEHVPRADTDEQRDRVASLPIDYWEDHHGHYHIQGFRIYEGEDRGANKSCTEGNGEHGTMANFMFPDMSNVHRHHVWINKKQTLRIMDNIEVTGTYYAGNEISNKYDQYWVSLDNPSDPGTGQTLYVTGSIDPASRSAVIKRALVSNSNNRLEDELVGQFEIHAIDQSGNVIARNSFDAIGMQYDCFSDDVPETLSFFTQIELPQGSNVSSLQVLSNGKVWGEFNPSRSTPQVTLIQPERKAVLSEEFEISWTATDSDSDKLTFTVLYSPDGNENWVPLGRTASHSMQINTSTLPAGESPLLRVQASDGFNTASADVPVILSFQLRLIGHHTRDTITPHESIVATFSAPLDPRTLNEESFYLTDTASNKDVPCLITYDTENHQAILKPLEPLTAGQSYHVTLSTNAAREIIPEEEPSQDEEESSDPFSSFHSRVQQLFDQQNQAKETNQNVASSASEEGLPITDIMGNSMGQVEWEVYVEL